MDIGVDQALQLLRRRRSAKLRPILAGHIVDPGLTYDDLSARFIRRRDQSMNEEQRQSDEQEMDQGLAN